MSRRNKAGRPRNKAADKLREKVVVLVRSAEKKSLQERADEAGVSVSEYVRELLALEIEANA